MSCCSLLPSHFLNLFLFCLLHCVDVILIGMEIGFSIYQVWFYPPKIKTIWQIGPDWKLGKSNLNMDIGKAKCGTLRSPRCQAKVDGAMKTTNMLGMGRVALTVTIWTVRWKLSWFRNSISQATCEGAIESPRFYHPWSDCQEPVFTDVNLAII
jgi:hypothetical protein